MDIYLVGGAVRDQLLNYPHQERDWVVVGAHPEMLIKQGYQPVGKDFPVFLHPETREEYALARTERKTGPGYTGFDCYASPDVTLEEDLKRRDLTINAMARSADGALIDPYHGQADLQARVLRHVSPAFTEDPLRVLRVARFAARYAHLGFRVADETLQLMTTLSESGELRTLPGERLWRETEKALSEATPEQFFITLKSCGAIKALMPELSELDDFSGASASLTGPDRALINFALLCQALSSEQLEPLCQRIKAPNSFRQLAQLANDCLPLFERQQLGAGELLALLNRCDAFRKQNNLEHLLVCAEQRYPDSKLPELLRQALDLCKAINTQEIITTGFSGKAIGEELKRRRLAALQPLANQA